MLAAFVPNCYCTDTCTVRPAGVAEKEAPYGEGARPETGECGAVREACTLCSQLTVYLSVSNVQGQKSTYYEVTDRTQKSVQMTMLISKAKRLGEEVPLTSYLCSECHGCYSP